MDVDNRLKFDAISDIVDIPTVIHVVDFDDTAVTKFLGEFDRALNSYQSVIPVVINSYGGRVYSLLSMVDAIKSSPKPVMTVATGKAMSCGAILLACGSPGLRYATARSTVMIYDASHMSYGKVEDAKASVEELDRLNKIILGILDQHGGKQPGYFNEMLDQRNRVDWILSPEEAVTHGVVDRVGYPSLEVTVKLDTRIV